MATAIRAPPDPDPIGVDLLPRLRVRDGVLDVADLDRGQDLEAVLAGPVVGLAEAAVVEDEAVHGQGRGEVLCECVQVHLLEGGEAVAHDQTWRGLWGGDGFGLDEPPPQRHVVACLEGDIFIRHVGFGSRRLP